MSRVRPAYALAALALAAFGIGSGFVGHQLNSHPRLQSALTRASLAVDREGSRYLSRLGFRCGVEAWSVKTLTDAGSGQVDLIPRRTTITMLVALSGSPGHRADPPRTYLLSGTRLIRYKLEPDSDIHLVLRSTIAPHPTMIVEIPAPACASGSRVLAQITQARADFEARVGQPQTFFTNLDIPVRLVGVAFFDFAHGQTGVAANSIELHPLISFIRQR